MADNVIITAGTGTTIATDQVGTDHYQRVKLTDGTADSSTVIAVDVGVKANALRVAPANDITDATYIGDIKFGEALATVTNVTSLDKSVYVDDADWTDDTSSHTLVGGIYQSAPHTVTDGDVSPFQLDVNGCIILGTSAKAIGKLAANTGVDIGDVDVTSIVPGVAATNLGKAEDAAHASGDVGVAAMTVRADAAVALSGADNDYQPLITDANGRLHVIEVNSTTMDADTGAIKLATEIMDDWDATHASAAPADGAMIMGAAYSAGLPTDVGADADAARICTDRYGRVLSGLMPQNFQATFNSADAQAASPVKAKTVDRKMYILSLTASTDTALNLQFQDDTGPTVLIENLYLAANGGCHLTWPPEAPLVVNTNEDFDVIASAAGNVSVTITGYLAV